ncbi:MAG: rhamnogalacturonan acetylesterase, partial [Lachnospiraceae bacterium]|nr:rhamnogalacturonan acetylesterase [Lachnospiraceae bacterium]
MRLNYLLAAIASACIAMSASGQNHVPPPMEDVNHVVDNTLDSLNKARTARPEAGSTRRGNNPVLFLVGNSTMRTGTLGNGDNGQWGWGYFMPEYFDPEKITVENHALGGMSSRTFYTRLWADVVKGIRPGDWVIIELGHNDNGPYDSGRARASIRGIGKDSLNVTIKETGEKETVYTYGEYMRRYIDDVRRAGGHPILMSLTPRCAWDDKDSTKVTRVNETFGLWAKQIAQEKGVPFVDLNDITARKFERFGKEKVKTMFYLDRIHTSEFGARVNAESAVEGLKGLSNVPLKDWMV